MRLDEAVVVRRMVVLLGILAVTLFLGVIMVLGQETESVFHAICPICHSEAIQPSSTAQFVTNSVVASEPGGRTVIQRTVRMTCPNVSCGTIFQAQANYWVPDVIATEVKVPMQTRKSLQSMQMSLPPIPAIPLIVRTNADVIVAPSGRRLVSRHLSTMTVDELVSLYNTNSASVFLVEIVPK